MNKKMFDTPTILIVLFNLISISELLAKFILKRQIVEAIKPTDALIITLIMVFFDTTNLRLAIKLNRGSKKNITTI